MPNGIDVGNVQLASHHSFFDKAVNKASQAYRYFSPTKHVTHQGVSVEVANDTYGAQAYQRLKKDVDKALTVAPLLAMVAPHPVTYGLALAGGVRNLVEAGLHGQKVDKFSAALTFMSMGSKLGVEALYWGRNDCVDPLQGIHNASAPVFPTTSGTCVTVAQAYPNASSCYNNASNNPIGRVLYFKTNQAGSIYCQDNPVNQAETGCFVSANNFCADGYPNITNPYQAGPSTFACYTTAPGCWIYRVMPPAPHDYYTVRDSTPLYQLNIGAHVGQTLSSENLYPWLSLSRTGYLCGAVKEHCKSLLNPPAITPSSTALAPASSSSALLTSSSSLTNTPSSTLLARSSSLHPSSSTAEMTPSTAMRSSSSTVSELSSTAFISSSSPAADRFSSTQSVEPSSTELIEPSSVALEPFSTELIEPSSTMPETLSTELIEPSSVEMDLPFSSVSDEFFMTEVDEPLSTEINSPFSTELDEFFTSKEDVPSSTILAKSSSVESGSPSPISPSETPAATVEPDFNESSLEPLIGGLVSAGVGSLLLVVGGVGVAELAYKYCNSKKKEYDLPMAERVPVQTA